MPSRVELSANAVACEEDALGAVVSFEWDSKPASVGTLADSNAEDSTARSDPNRKERE